jgi:hypothetical protein
MSGRSANAGIPADLEVITETTQTFDFTKGSID